METSAAARQVLAAIRDTSASDADRRRITAITLKERPPDARGHDGTTEWGDDFIESYVLQQPEEISPLRSQ